MFILLFIWSWFPFLNDSLSLRYDFRDESKLQLNGSTNLTNFSCECRNAPDGGQIKLKRNPLTGEIAFEDSRILIPSRLLDCKNRLINRDLCESLNAAKYPNIEVELLSALPTHGTSKMVDKGLYKFKTKAAIRIAGVSKVQQLEVLFQQLDKKSYKLFASKDVSMNAYHIVPKSPVKFIRIDDTIRINFELIVAVSDPI